MVRLKEGILSWLQLMVSFRHRPAAPQSTARGGDGWPVMLERWWEES